MLRSAGLVLAVSLAWGSANAFAQSPFEGTPREQAACRPDVVKMCKEFLSPPPADTFKILACLQAHRGRLSPPCYEVLKSHNQVP